jgi:hypothetical protein
VPPTGTPTPSVPEEPLVPFVPFTPEVPDVPDGPAGPAGPRVCFVKTILFATGVTVIEKSVDGIY